MYTQEINLKKGWNVVSFFLYDINFIDIIKNQEISSIKNLNETYNSLLGPNLSSLKSVDTKQLYWIYSTKDFSFSVTGNLIDYSNLEEDKINDIKNKIKLGKSQKVLKKIKLNKGWNQISFDIYNINFKSLIKNTDVNQIKTIKSSYNKKIPFDFNTLKSINIKEGYFIDAENSTILEVEGYLWDYNLIKKELEILKFETISNNDTLNLVKLHDKYLVDTLVNVYNASLVSVIERDNNKIYEVNVILSKVNYLNLSSPKFKILSDLEIFKKLEVLNLSNTEIKNFDIDVPCLKELYCNNSDFNFINTKLFLDLEVFEIKNSKINELNLENNLKLTYFNSEGTDNLKILIWDSNIPKKFGWKIEYHSEFYLKEINIPDFEFYKLLRNSYCITGKDGKYKINTNMIKKLDISKYYKDKNLSSNTIKDLTGIEHFKNLEILNLNDTKEINKVNLENLSELKIFYAENSDLNDFSLVNNYQLEKLNLNNLNLEKLELPNVSTLIDTTQPYFKVTKNDGLFTVENIKYYGRIANEDEKYDYKLNYAGFNSSERVIFINDLEIIPKIDNNVTYYLIDFLKLNKKNYINILENLKFSVYVYPFPESSPEKYIFNYNSKLFHNPHLVYTDSLNINKFKYAFQIEIQFNYPKNDLYRLNIDDSYLSGTPIDNKKYNLYLFDDEKYFRNYVLTYNQKFKSFETTKDILKNINNQYRVILNDHNLETLISSKNQIKSINLENHKSLRSINLNSNQINDLDITKNNNLLRLFCENNKLKELSLNENINLRDLNCSCNFLNELNVSTNNNLVNLNISNNFINKIDLKENKNLKKINCSDNKLFELNISNNELLEILNCEENEILEIDIRNNPLLNLKESNIGETILKNGEASILKYSNDFNLEIINEFIGKTFQTMDHLINRITFTISNENDKESLLKEFSILLGRSSYSIYIIDELNNKEIMNFDSSNKLEFSLKSNGNSVVVPNNFREDLFLLSNNNSVECKFKFLTIESFEFLKYLESLGGKIYLNNVIYIDVNNIFHINVSNYNIESINEIKNFPNLISLECKNCKLTNLDVSHNKNLIYLNCYNNNLQSINLVKNENLMFVFLGQNDFVNLDLSKQEKLVYFNAIRCKNLIEVNLDNFNNHKIEKLLLFECYNLQKLWLDRFDNNLNIPIKSQYSKSHISSHLINYFDAKYVDKKLEIPNVENIKKLVISNQAYSNLNGIENLTSLTDLNINNSKLSYVPVNRCMDNSMRHPKIWSPEFNLSPTLEKLYITNSEIENIDLTLNHNLKVLNLSGNSKLRIIDLANNNNDNIESINIENCKILEKIIIDKRQTKIPDSWNFSNYKVEFKQ